MYLAINLTRYTERIYSLLFFKIIFKGEFRVISWLSYEMCLSLFVDHKEMISV